MIKKRTFIFILSILPFFVNAQLGILKKGLREATILNAPTVSEYTLHDPDYRYSFNLENGYSDERAAWIVYSDRANNSAFQNASKESQPLKKLDFMQACFVIGESGDYLELAQYVPGINLSANKKKLPNPEYIGWVSKSNLLLWNKALKDKKSNVYIKSITALGAERVAEILPNHVAQDSIITFADPFLKTPIAKCGMENIFYIYKESSDGNEYLAGPDPTFLPENSAKSGICWISKDLLRVWGTKGFITLNPLLNASIPFYQKKPTVTNELPEEGLIALKQSPYTTPASNLEKLYPIVKYSGTTAGKAIIYSGFLEEALDKGNATLRNVSGDIIDNKVIEQFRIKSPKLNIVVVVAGGRNNLQYIGNLQSLLSSNQWYNTTKKNFNSINIGAVVYEDYGPNCTNDVAPLTQDEKYIDAFLAEHLNGANQFCDDGDYYQALYGGVVTATKMLSNHAYESNIILVYGSGADNMGNKGEAITGLTAAMARLLVFQTHNKDGQKAYSDFVGNAEDLINLSAQNIINLKKSYIVPNTYPNVIGNTVEYISDSTKQIHHLDYPAKSITQGYEIYPKVNENMDITALSNALDSLIISIAYDNALIDNAFQGALAQSNSASTKIKNEFQYRFPSLSSNLPASFIKGNTLRNQNFLIPGWMVISGSDKNNQTGLSSGVLLNIREYNEFTNQLALLGSGSVRTKDAIVAQIKKAIETTERSQDICLEKDINAMTFSEVMSFLTGYYPVDAVWMQTTLSQFQKNKNISIDVGLSFIEESRNKAIWLRDHNNNANIQIQNNGRVYYQLDEDNLPVNTATDDSEINIMPSIQNVQTSTSNSPANKISPPEAPKTKPITSEKPVRQNNFKDDLNNALNENTKSPQDIQNPSREENPAINYSNPTTKITPEENTIIPKKPITNDPQSLETKKDNASYNSLLNDINQKDSAEADIATPNETPATEEGVRDYRSQLTKSHSNDTQNIPKTENEDEPAKKPVEVKKDDASYNSLLNDINQKGGPPEDSKKETTGNSSKASEEIKSGNPEKTQKNTTYNDLLSDLDKAGKSDEKTIDKEDTDKNKKKGKETRKKRNK